MGLITVSDTILGSSFGTIQQAVHVLDRKKLKLELYKIQLLAHQDAVVALFTDQDPQGVRESYAVRKGADTELTPHDLTLLLSQRGDAKKLDSLQGTSLLAIRAAVGEVLRHTQDLDQFKIEVLREGDAIVVAFTNKDLKPGVRGGGGKLAFEVELNASDLKVRRSNFIR
jgi:hypothetical protein